MRFLGFSLAAILFALAAFAHYGLFRLVLARSAWAARHRTSVAIVVFLLAGLPLLRALSGLWSPLRLGGQLGLLWHLVLVSAAAVTVVVSGLARLATRRRATDDAPPADPSKRDAIVGASALAASTAVYGWGAAVNRRAFEISELAVKIPRLSRALDGFTIVQLSDIHVGPLMDERELARVVASANALRPDLIVITGDIIDAEKRWIEAGARALSTLRARFGVVGVPGNHDHYTGLDAVRSGLARGGVDLLVNRGKTIAASDGGIALLGVDDLYARRFGAGPDLARARAMVRPDLPTILLAHQPPFFDETEGHAIDLQLSGHTHGGQINPGFTPAKWVFQYVAGRYDRADGSTLYVNRGLGVVGPPVRLGAPPELTKIVLASG